jgi:hypothetical protein
MLDPSFPAQASVSTSFQHLQGIKSLAGLAGMKKMRAATADDARPAWTNSCLPYDRVV